MNYCFILSYIKNQTIIQYIKQVLREKDSYNNNTTTVISNNNSTHIPSKIR